MIEGQEKTCPGVSREIKSCYVLPSLNDLGDWEFSGGTSGLIKDDTGILTLLKSKGINDEFGVYASGSGDLKINSKEEFIIPSEAKSFFIRVLVMNNIGDISATGDVSYKLVVDGTKKYVDGTPVIGEGNMVIGRRFSLDPTADAGKNARIEVTKEVTKTGGGSVAITNIGYEL